MKKLLFSAILIGTFAAYVVFARQRTPSADLAPIVLETGRSNASSDVPAAASNALPPPSSAPPSPPNRTAPSAAAPPTPPSPTRPRPIGAYRDGAYTGYGADAYYGTIQVRAIIKDGKIADVQFLDYPRDRNQSIRINSQAMPWLTSEAIQAQSANVDTISGATDTSAAFKESLASALAQAKN